MLDTTTAAVDSALRRARASLAEAGPVEDDLAEPDEATRRTLLDGYVDAFTQADADALVSLLRADIEMEMPPIPTWFTGQWAVAGFLAGRVLRRDLWRMVPTRANGQPALVVYRRSSNGRYEAYGIQLLTLIGARISRITAFNDPRLVPTFALAPATRPEPGPAAAMIATPEPGPLLRAGRTGDRRLARRWSAVSRS
ncbi:sigma-70 family RNA polymerase sigma factor family protein [Nonomuraea turcica]|uniref:hypothetical protein n=1 Tax=Nonomuraea sp. G32 TaxID=3067274 RepID=UPI00273C8C5F|nr:hypothetical protein [Nonomuraea sp. G32]MDP4511561.1 hypothetical protein [Nonomuraea sp. G32]